MTVYPLPTYLLSADMPVQSVLRRARFGESSVRPQNSPELYLLGGLSILIACPVVYVAKMVDKFTIVPVEDGDQIDQVRTLFREYASSLGFSLCFQSFDAELAGLPGEYSPPAGQLLLAFCDSIPAGCVALRKLEDGICEMKRLYDRPEFRGHGLGKDLVSSSDRAGSAIMYSKMRLDTIAASMAEAVGLYRSMGFCDIPPYCRNPIPGAIYLELDLGKP